MTTLNELTDGYKIHSSKYFCGKKLIYVLRNLPGDAERSQIWSYRDAPRHKVTNLFNNAFTILSLINDH